MTPRSCRTPSAAIVRARTRRSRDREVAAAVGSAAAGGRPRPSRGLRLCVGPNGGPGSSRGRHALSRPASTSRSARSRRCSPRCGSVDRAPAERRVGLLDRQGLVEPVGVDRGLDVLGVADVQRRADLLGPAATSSWIFRPAPPARSACQHQVLARGGAADEQRGVQGYASSAAHAVCSSSGGLQPRFQTRPGSWMTSARQPARQRGVGDLRREPVHVGVDAAGRDDEARGVVDRGGGVQDDVDPVHRVRLPARPTLTIRPSLMPIDA